MAERLDKYSLTCLVPALLLLVSCEMHQTNFTSERVQRSATIYLNGTIEQVFPLFGPIREKDWAHGWDPHVIYPKDTLVAKHMVFRTHENYTWTIVKYEPSAYLIEYLVSDPDRLWYITVQCNSAGQQTSAVITYSYTGLSEEGNRRNDAAITKMFAFDLKDWEQAINHYLKTGTQLN
jgi:hypothetical protein